MELKRQHHLVGDGVELFENFDRARGIVAADDEALAAPEDGDVERGRDLAQVFIERAAQVGQPVIVERLGDEIVRLDRVLGFQLALCNSMAPASSSPRRV